MKWLNGYRMRLPFGSELRAELVLVGLGIAAFLTQPAVSSDFAGVPPIADAGLPRYAAQDQVVLDGTGSYDPDNSGTLSYTWRQISGPAVVITDEDTDTATISGFVQTNEIQECEFELVVGDGELTSLPDTVKVVIVPTFTESTMVLENDSFNPDKPTIIYFSGASTIDGKITWGMGRGAWSGGPAWEEKANIISFYPWVIDKSQNWWDGGPEGAQRTSYTPADMIIVYLSAVAPHYDQAIQTMGLSLGGIPAVDVALRLNTTYADARYAVNRVSFLDASTYALNKLDVSPILLGIEEYGRRVAAFLASSVEGEQCWLDTYNSLVGGFYPSALNVGFSLNSHTLPRNWYRESLTNDYANKFNQGIVAGAYWSVIGPGKNLQLASTPDAQTYKFKWYGGATSGYMDFHEEAQYPGRLPEPVTLVGPADGTFVDANGALFSCEESENAVGYQLLFGRDPYHMVYLFSDTPSPPAESVITFPFEQCWWTVRAYDAYGSTIHADPMHIKAESVIAQTVENATTGQIYPSIQQAINDAQPGDEIVLSSGICQYLESINFKGKNLMIRSTNPDDPTIVAATVINGGDQGTVVTLSGTKETDCVLAGLTILGGTVGVSCRAEFVTIRNCTIKSNGPNAIEFRVGYEPPAIIDCTILGEVVEKNVLALVTYWALDEEEGMVAYDGAGTCDGRLLGDPVWQPDEGLVAGALQFDGVHDCILTGSLPNTIEGPFSVFACVKGGAPGQVVISQRGGVNWLCADTLEGNLMTELMGTGRVVAILSSQTNITDGNWHRIGLVWDGSQRTLYVDDVVVAEDTLANLEVSQSGLLIGTGKAMKAGTFWSGLIDDVRIYSRAINP